MIAKHKPISTLYNLLSLTTVSTVGKNLAIACLNWLSHRISSST